ncbi:MAG: hypothetical protein Q4G63_13135 [Bacteroidia bacterium]|nr:hypothetical protein [Bacteroidia bacterium]
MAKKDFTQNITSGIDALLQPTTPSNRNDKQPQKKVATEEKKFVNYNYVIDRNTYKTLKIQSAIEERPIIEILQDALNLYFSNNKVNK